MWNDSKGLRPKSFRQRVEKAVTRAVIGTKYKLGLGLTDTKRKTLDKIYYDASTGYSSIDELQRRSGFNTKDVLDYLQHQETYTKHRPANTRFPKRKVITHSPPSSVAGRSLCHAFSFKVQRQCQLYFNGDRRLFCDMPMPFQSETKPVIMLQRHSRNLTKRKHHNSCKRTRVLNL